MRVIVATEARLFRHDDGTLHAPTQGRAYAFWTRYLEEFNDVGVLARVSDIPGTGGYPVEGPGVKVMPVTDFNGVKGLMLKGRLARTDVRRWAESRAECALIGRLPGVVGGMLVSYAQQTKRPYAIEVVGDPYSAVLTAGLGAQGRRAMAVMARAHMRRQVRGAGAVAYVTRELLQQVYPSEAGAVVASYSSVELPDEAFRALSANPGASAPFHLVMVGTMSQAYKGHDVLLHAMAVLKQRGVATRASLVGDGQLRREIQQTARALSVDVTFLGQVGSPAEVRAVLDDADLFVMPSRSEGLPRALIEAMARSLPAVASDVGGIPELLEQGSMVPPDEHIALAEVIYRHLVDDELRLQQATRNHHVARQYHQAALTKERSSFYSAVRAQMEQHCQQLEER